MVYELENTNDGHNKFYRINCYGFKDSKSNNWNKIFVTITFGKIGTMGRVIHKEFKNIWDAIEYADKKRNEKLCFKNYRLVN
jgi:predicted DNA-binding WGR domain protein